jgi:hypothetical protein
LKVVYGGRGEESRERAPPVDAGRTAVRPYRTLRYLVEVSLAGCLQCAPTAGRKISLRLTSRNVIGRLCEAKNGFFTRGGTMNARLVMKFVLILAVLLFMVMMGMSNDDMVTFRLGPLGYSSHSVRSAFMYFIFFGAGVLTGGLLAVGVGGSKSKSKS